MSDICYRSIKPSSDDFADIAKLHTLSWQLWYKGIFTDDYLIHDLPTEHLQKWSLRKDSFDPQHTIALGAFDKTTLVGFAYAIYEADKNTVLLDNLHVHPNYHHKGIGYGLIKGIAKWVEGNFSGTALRLEVYKKNTKAVNFYQKLGAKLTDIKQEQMPHGTFEEFLCFEWGSLELILE